MPSAMVSTRCQPRRRNVARTYIVLHDNESNLDFLQLLLCRREHLRGLFAPPTMRRRRLQPEVATNLASSFDVLQEWRTGQQRVNVFSSSAN